MDMTISARVERLKNFLREEIQGTEVESILDQDIRKIYVENSIKNLNDLSNSIDKEKTAGILDKIENAFLERYAELVIQQMKSDCEEYEKHLLREMAEEGIPRRVRSEIQANPSTYQFNPSISSRPGKLIPQQHQKILDKYRILVDIKAVLENKLVQDAPKAYDKKQAFPTQQTTNEATGTSKPKLRSATPKTAIEIIEVCRQKLAVVPKLTEFRSSLSNDAPEKSLTGIALFIKKLLHSLSRYMGYEPVRGVTFLKSLKTSVEDIDKAKKTLGGIKNVSDGAQHESKFRKQ